MFVLAWLGPSIRQKQTHGLKSQSLRFWPLLRWEKEVKQQRRLQQRPSAVLPLLLGGDQGPLRVSARFAFLLEHPRGCNPTRERRCPTAQPEHREGAGLGAGREPREWDASKVSKEATQRQEKSPGWREVLLAPASKQMPAPRGASRGSVEQR